MHNLISNIKYSYTEVYVNAKAFFFLFIIKTFFNSIRVFFTAWLSKSLLNEILNGLNSGVITKKLFFLSLSVLGFEILYTVFLKIVEYYSEKSTLNYNQYISMKIAKKCGNLKYQFFDNPKDKNDLRQFVADSRATIDLFCQTITLIAAVISFCISFLISIEFSIFITVLSLLASIPSFFIRQKIKDDGYETQKELNLLNRKIDYFKGIFSNKSYYKEIHVFNVEGYFLKILENYLSERKRERNSYNRKKLLRELLLVLFFSIFNMIVNMLLIVVVIISKLTIGDYTYYNSIISSMKNNSENVVATINEISISSKKISNVLLFLNNNNEYEKNGDDLDLIISKITFQNVWFKYPSTEDYVLKDISFEILANEKIAFAGVNGVGKTTLINLLLRFYRPTKGKILINDVDINNYKIENYWRLFSVMFQNANLFNMSLRENILLSDITRLQNLDNNHLKKILNEIDLEVNERYFNSQVSKNFDKTGLIFSPGQAQKINVVKTVLRESPIIIFDEPLSAIDAVSEEKITQKIFNQSRNRLLILISHRMGNLKEMDKIVFLKDGCVQAIGTHNELMKNNVSYSIMYNTQAQKYN